MNSKQRAYLRGLANTMPAIFQVGKNGISENFITLFRARKKNSKINLPK